MLEIDSRRLSVVSCVEIRLELSNFEWVGVVAMAVLGVYAGGTGTGTERG
jgi:hypothetical protein